MFRIAFRLLLALVALLALAAAGAWIYLKLSLPKVEGSVRLAGLKGRVEILRDSYGIPHIFAASVDDAFFALGYAHAQDRLWQMEMSRRVGAGRLAEILGPAALETDRFLRTLGVRRAATASVTALEPQTQASLEAYARGVNAWLAEGHVLPPEFLLLRVTPEPWSPADSVAWTKMMAWDLGGNWRNELLRMRLATTLPNRRLNEILPPYPGEAPPRLPELRELYARLGIEPASLALAAAPLETTAERYLAGAAGSNNWVVAGARTTSGKPLLANDPHLGLSAPPVWYFAHLSAPGLNAIGATLPGVPAIVLGRNERIAWGFTNTGPDVQDLYVEKLVGAEQYLTPEGPRPFKVIEETIRVKGAPDVVLRVRETRHGPVISDVSKPALEATPRGHVLAFAWTALAHDDRTLQSAAGIGRARDWQGFVDAVRDFQAPQQNMVYADVDGNIGFIAAGHVPVRKPENDLQGLAPAPGWLGKYDWAGTIPFGELPKRYNPVEGVIVTANHRITPPDYAHHITSEWQPPYRADRIRELIDAVPQHSLASFARIQADAQSRAVRELLPHLLRTEARSAGARQAIELLRRWDGVMAVDRVEPLLVTAWWRELARAIYADELGEVFRPNWRARAVFIGNVLADRDGQGRWCDDVRTSAVETCAQLLAASLEAALDDLRSRYGENMRDWTWGPAHAAHHEHRPLGRQKLLARLFDISVPSAGDAYTVNVGRNNFYDEARPYANRHAASLRAIYDFADLENSLFVHSGGQSGNPLSAHYDAFSRAWAKGEYIPMRMDRKRIESAGVSRLVLEPR